MNIPNLLIYAIGNRIYTPAEAENATTVRWPFGDALTLIVNKPGGLKPGIHEVKVLQRLRISYHPDPAKPGGPITGSENPSGYSTFLGRTYWAKVSRDPKEQLLKLLPYTYHAHGKFFEMTEELREYSIPYEHVIPVLLEGGYDCHIASEYEGQRYIQDVSDPSGIEQVRRQHAMFKRLCHQLS